MRGRTDHSRRQFVGNFADSARNRRIAKRESADLQQKCGAPGWNRTSGTRFRNHAEGVIARSASCANVLHGPRFCAVSVMGRAQAYLAVVRRLVGIVSAVKLAEGVTNYLSLYHEITLHETPRQKRPLVVHRAAPHPFHG
jgi:hypothetical protein